MDTDLTINLLRLAAIALGAACGIGSGLVVLLISWIGKK